jgi:hypothetical protein
MFASVKQAICTIDVDVVACAAALPIDDLSQWPSGPQVMTGNLIVQALLPGQ